MPRPVLQSVPGLLRHAHGRARRGAERSSLRTRSTRTSSSYRPRSWPRSAGAGVARRGAARARGRQTFLKAGGVFTDDLIETWIDYKRLNEIDAGAPTPAPLGVHALLRHLGFQALYQGSSDSEKHRGLEQV